MPLMASGSHSHMNPLWKGKGKASEQEFNDINPAITYRHLHAQNLGVRDPLRVIALCDSDAFYAACEMVRLGTDKDTPLVVQQWNALIAVNYPARKYGITRFGKKTIEEIKRMCPGLVVVHVATLKPGESKPGYWDEIDSNTHKISLDYYRAESKKVAAMFKDRLPASCEIERASIDEAFIDFTRPVRELLLERYPQLEKVPPDAPDGLDTPLPPPPPICWADIGSLIPINPPSPDVVASDSEIPPFEKAGAHDEVAPTWHDVALSIAAELMEKARKDVHTELGYSTSAGIARNKFLAKLTASYKKPNNQSILRNASIPNYLKPLAFQKIRFLGGKLGKSIAEEFDASTVEDLLSLGLAEMQNKFEDNAIWIYEILRGIDRTEVREKPSALKSMLASKNLPKYIKNASEGHQWIRVLAAELSLRLNEARQEDPHLWPKSLVLHARRRDRDGGRSKQTNFPFTRELTIEKIAVVGDRLWNELVKDATTLSVSCIQLAFTGIEATEAGQQSIDAFLRKRLRDTDEDTTSVEAADGNHLEDGDSITDQHDNDISAHAKSWMCARCGKKLKVPIGLQDREEEEVLKLVKMEHDDYHFAQDLDKATDNTIQSPVKKKQKRVEPKGIEKFFSRK